MLGRRKTIILPDELAAQVDEFDEYGQWKSLAKVVAELHAPQYERALRDQPTRPKSFDLSAFFTSQGEALLCDLADGASHSGLFLRYSAKGKIPAGCSYQRFTAALAEYRQLQGLPPRHKPRAESVTFRRARPVRPARPAITPLPAPSARPPMFVRPRYRREGDDWVLADP